MNSSLGDAASAGLTPACNLFQSVAPFVVQRSRSLPRANSCFDDDLSVFQQNGGAPAWCAVVTAMPQAVWVALTRCNQRS
jgi:hypothetical protein